MDRHKQKQQERQNALEEQKKLEDEAVSTHLCLGIYLCICLQLFKLSCEIFEKCYNSSIAVQCIQYIRTYFQANYHYRDGSLFMGMLGCILHTNLDIPIVYIVSHTGHDLALFKWRSGKSHVTLNTCTRHIHALTSFSHSSIERISSEGKRTGRKEVKSVYKKCLVHMSMCQLLSRDITISSLCCTIIGETGLP